MKRSVQNPDAAPILDEEWFRTATLVMPERKIPVSIRVDREIVEWFKAQGPRYQSRMNAVLKAFRWSTKTGCRTLIRRTRIMATRLFSAALSTTAGIGYIRLSGW